MAAKKASSSGQAWFCTTGLPTDVVIEVGDMSFHLHKFPLMSKSRKLHQLIADGEEDDEIEEVEEDFQHIALPDFPGGADIFEAAAKFCYGVKVEITACSVAALRCAAEYLEMTEEFAEENLVAKTERFLDQSVLRSSRDSVKALKSCENLHTMAEDLGLVQRFVDSITALASATADLSSLSGRAVATLWNGIDYGIRRKNGVRTPAIASAAAADSWFDDLATLGLPFYKRVISAMKDKDLSADVIECSLISYAKRSIPGLSRSNRHQTNANTAAATSASHPMPSETEQKELLETIINNLPHSNKKISSCSSGQFTTRFLFGLLRTANILRASEDSRTVLERKIASHLEHATLDDLLMPSYSYLVETLYDVDCVERILSYFLEELEATAATADSANDGSEEGLQMCNDENKLLMAGKLMDLFLSETASDANLKPDKFCDLAQALPAMARAFDDGLYRSVDVYLKGNGLPEVDAGGVHACGAERAAAFAGGGAGALLRAAAAAASDRGHADGDGSIGARGREHAGLSDEREKGEGRVESAVGDTGKPGAEAGHGQHAEPGERAGERVLRAAEGNRANGSESGCEQQGDAGAEAWLQVQHTGVRFAPPDGGGAEEVPQDDDRDELTVIRQQFFAASSTSPSAQSPPFLLPGVNLSPAVSSLKILIPSASLPFSRIAASNSSTTEVSTKPSTPRVLMGKQRGIDVGDLTVAAGQMREWPLGGGKGRRNVDGGERARGWERRRIESRG
ncbi:hypothetical protein ZIOFF_072180 [Zingiber officinale]|uniref:Phototropic-responsive NPH3 family protein n=1 Tax=Zingiber officinale TaxID=94328 RepID=A0A8J5C2L6_ZINOF|nr:hypothetical protein ZIOFF_072180 [Zingiber officinale]